MITMSDFFSDRCAGSYKSDNIDLDFVYADCDSHANEISELYSYTEEDEFFGNRDRFHELMEDNGLPLRWSDMTDAQKQRVVELLSNTSEHADIQQRQMAIRATLYLLQGVFSECCEIEDQRKWTRQVVFYLYERDFFLLYVQLLSAELNRIEKTNPTVIQRNLQDSTMMRMILNVLYTFVEVMLREEFADTPRRKAMRDQFREELSHPMPGSNELLTITLFNMTTNFCNTVTSPLPIKKILLLLWKVILVSLGGMDTLKELKEKYRKNVNLPPVPDDTMEIVQNMRSITPPLMLNEFNDDQKSKFGEMSLQGKRKGPMFRRQMSVNKFNGRDGGEQNGNSFEDNTNGNGGGGDGTADGYDVDTLRLNESEDIKKDVNEEENGDLTLRLMNKTESSGDNEGDMTVAEDGNSNDVGDGEIEKKEEEIDVDENDDDDDYDGRHRRGGGQGQGEEEGEDRKTICETPRPGSPGLSETKDEVDANDELLESTSINTKGLPWAPKVRQADMDEFLDRARKKFIGFSLPNDRTTLAGLPQPIVESIKVLRQHVYISLAELQIQREDDFIKYPLTAQELDECTLDSPAERLYRAMISNAPHYMIALLKIVFAAAPSTKAKSDSINVTNDMMPAESPTSVLENLKLSIDVNRHKEIIVKAVSSIILLLLKHYKINHIFQFEYLGQLLMFANCIPLILKYFNQNVSAYIQSKNNISVIDFPACVIGEQTELTNELLEMGCFDSSYCWRNLYSFINLLRIMVKLNKWKNVRITSLILLKSQNILRKALKVRQATLQLYVLKLFKMQTRILGRPWRKANMKILGAIYQKVRHRFNDGWALNSLMEIPDNLQKEEFALQAKIAQFHKRRYFDKGSGCLPNMSWNPQPPSLTESVDFDCVKDFELYELFNNEIELTDDFKDNYQHWLEQEVFDKQVDWDLLLESTDTSDL